MNWVKKYEKAKSIWSKVKVPFEVLTVIFGRSVRILFWSEFTMGSRYRSFHENYGNKTEQKINFIIINF